MATRKRRTFTKKFKADVVKLVLEGGRSQAEVARQFDLSESSVNGWVKQAKVDAGQGPVGALTSAEKEELTKLRKENRELRMERDFLKKAAAFFAKHQK